MPRCLIGLLIFVTSASAQEASPEPTPSERLDDYLERCAEFGWSGTVLVARDGELVLRKGYGTADRAAGRANAADTLFEVASVTKPFTACAIMKLEEAGKLELDDPIAKYLPGVPEDKRDITIRHLLSHTSGMPRNGPSGEGPDLETAVARYLSAERTRPSGQVHEYWNGGYALLSGLIEVVSGTPYAEFCREQLFVPAGMTSTGFTGDARLPRDRQAVGYRGDQVIRRAAEHPYGGSYGYQYRGMGGIVTSADDLLRFTQALDAGRIVAPATLKRMETVVRDGRGLAWSVGETTRDTTRVGHGGDVAGFHTQFHRFPDEGAVVIVLSNVDGIPLWSIAWNLESILFGQTPKLPMPPETVALGPRALDAFVGRYTMPKKAGAIVVERDGNGLVIGAEGQDLTELLATAPYPMRAEPEPPVALGVPDGLEAEVATAKKIVEAVVRKDADWIRSLLLEHIPKAWPDTLVGHIWGEQIGRFGALKQTAVLGARRLTPERVQIHLRLSHEKEERGLRIVLHAGQLSIFSLERTVVPEPSFDASIARARKVIEAATRKDAGWIRSILHPEVPPAWADRLVNEIWDEHLKSSGPVVDTDVVGATELAPGRVQVLLALRHESGDRRATLVFQDDLLNVFIPDGPRTAHAQKVLPVSEHRFESFSWLSRIKGTTAIFEPEGASLRTLRLTTATGQELVFTRTR